MNKAVVAGMGIVVALGVAAPTAAFAHPSGAKKLHISASPTKNVKPGTTIKVKATGAKKGAKYYCAYAVLNKKNPTGDYYANAGAIKTVKASKKGALKCSATFKPFSGISTGGESVSCPPSKKLAKKWSCAINLADVATQGQSSAGTVYFTAKK